MKNKIFLGGTCNNTTWRNELIKYLKYDYFNPVVENWTPECQQEESIQKEYECNIHYYHITSKMTGVFSIAEVIDSVHNKEKITILTVDRDGFDEFQIKSLQAVIDLVNLRCGTAMFQNDMKKIAETVLVCF
jgi:methyltransferase-like protein